MDIYEKLIKKDYQKYLNYIYTASQKYAIIINNSGNNKINWNKTIFKLFVFTEITPLFIIIVFGVK